jgi:hypothetical protein
VVPDVIVLVVISVLVSYLLLAVLSSLTLVELSRLSSSVSDFFMRPFVASASRTDLRSRRRRIEREIDRELGGGDPWGRQARQDVVRAALEARRIRILDRHFRRAIGSCVRTHWAVAEALGARDMAESAGHPACAQLRERVIDLSELLAEAIESYPLVSEELIRLHIGLSRIGPTCLTCPYFSATVQDAPRLCPPASAVGCSSPSKTSEVLDAEILDGV